MDGKKDFIFIGNLTKVKDYELFNGVINLTQIQQNAKDHIFESNGNKYLKVTVSARKEPGKYGDTHHIRVNDFVPENKKEEIKDELPF